MYNEIAQQEIKGKRRNEKLNKLMKKINISNKT